MALLKLPSNYHSQKLLEFELALRLVHRDTRQGNYDTARASIRLQMGQHSATTCFHHDYVKINERLGKANINFKQLYYEIYQTE